MNDGELREDSNFSMTEELNQNKRANSSRNLLMQANKEIAIPNRKIDRFIIEEERK